MQSKKLDSVSLERPELNLKLVLEPETPWCRWKIENTCFSDISVFDLESPSHVHTLSSLYVRRTRL